MRLERIQADTQALELDRQQVRAEVRRGAAERQRAVGLPTSSPTKSRALALLQDVHAEVRLKAAEVLSD